MCLVAMQLMQDVALAPGGIKQLGICKAVYLVHLEQQLLQLGFPHVCDGVAPGLGCEDGQHSTNLVGEGVDDCKELSLLLGVLHR